MQATSILDNKSCQQLCWIRHLGDISEYVKRGVLWKSYSKFLPGSGSLPIH